MPVARHFVVCRQPIVVGPPGLRHVTFCAAAGFTKCIPTTADGGLRGHVPARPGCTTPPIRFLFIAPQRWSRVSFLQIPFRDNALALLLAFGSAKTGPQDHTWVAM